MRQRATLSTLPADLIEAFHSTLTLKPADDSQRTAQPEMVKALHTALDARRQRIVISQRFIGRFRPRANHLNPNASFDFGAGGCLAQ